MKALFRRKDKTVYPNHLLDHSESSHPYYAPTNPASDLGTTARQNPYNSQRKTDDYGPARTTLDALQIIRRRFEEAAKEGNMMDQEAA